MSEQAQVKDYQVMKAELEAAGYHVVYDSDMKRTFVIFIDEWESRFPRKTMNDSIDLAWGHYQKEKQFQAMKALLRDIVSYEGKGYGFDHSAIIEALILSAKAILGNSP